MMKFIVTGSEGFIGKALCQRLKKSGVEVLGIDRKNGDEAAVKVPELLAKEKGATVAQIALAWLFCCGLNTFAVTGTSSAERMKENVAAFSLKLTQEECNFLNLEE